jgi:site-specific DNA-cytosine methylase
VTTLNPEGVPWEFSRAARRATARRMCVQDDPVWLVGSPPCAAFSILNRGLNYLKMSAEEVERRVVEG